MYEFGVASQDMRERITKVEVDTSDPRQTHLGVRFTDDMRARETRVRRNILPRTPPLATTTRKQLRQKEDEGELEAALAANLLWEKAGKYACVISAHARGEGRQAVSNRDAGIKRSLPHILTAAASEKMGAKYGRWISQAEAFIAMSQVDNLELPKMPRE